MPTHVGYSLSFVIFQAYSRIVFGVKNSQNRGTYKTTIPLNKYIYKWISV